MQILHTTAVSAGECADYDVAPNEIGNQTPVHLCVQLQWSDFSTILLTLSMYLNSVHMHVHAVTGPTEEASPFPHPPGS